MIGIAEMREEWNRAASHAKELRRIADIAEERAQNLIEESNIAFFKFRSGIQGHPEDYDRLHSAHMKAKHISQEATDEAFKTNAAANEAESIAARLHSKLINEIRMQEII